MDTRRKDTHSWKHPNRPQHYIGILIYASIFHQGRCTRALSHAGAQRRDAHTEVQGARAFFRGDIFWSVAHRVHVPVWYTPGPSRGSHVITLEPTYVLYRCLDVLVMSLSRLDVRNSYKGAAEIRLWKTSGLSSAAYWPSMV